MAEKKHAKGGRYIRKTIPIDKNFLPSHPLPEPVEEQMTYISSSDDATPTRGQSPESSSVSTARLSTSPVDVDGRDAQLPNYSTTTARTASLPSVRTASLWSATGNNTDRSSVCSLCEDEFDKQESEKVQQLFDEIDSMLFENIWNGQPDHLDRECRVWLSTFPHLRIIGRSLGSSEDVGYQFYPGTSGDDSLPSPTSSDVSDSSGLELAVHGMQLAKHRSPSSDTSEQTLSQVEFADETNCAEDETFEEDGCVEEFFAVDCSGDDVTPVPTRNRPLWSALPPMTPSVCVRTSVQQNIFIKLWAEFEEFHKTLCSGPHKLLSAVMCHVTSHRSADQDGDNRQPLPDMSSMFHSHRQFDGSPISRESSSLHANRFVGQPEKLSRQVSTLSSAGSVFGTTITVGQQPPLEGLLTISSKALQAREKTMHDTDLPLAVSLSVTRPGSSLTPVSGRMMAKMAERLMSARMRPNVRNKLAPLAVGDRARTPNVDEERHGSLAREVLRGVKMTTIPERFNSSSPMPPGGSSSSSSNNVVAVRSAGPLPPITRDLSNIDSLNGNNNNNSRRSWPLSVGASSSAAKATFSDREKAWSMSDSRPSTSKVMTWADGPLILGANRRSSTTLGFNNSLRTQNHLQLHSEEVVVGSRKLSVTGNNISAAASTHTSPLIPGTDDDDENHVNFIDSASHKLAKSPLIRRVLHPGHQTVKNSEGGSRRSGNSRFKAAVR